jgi:nitroreductase/NAD-dependent dihydropyrimidine dehydrogenase PreA subunit
MNPQEGRKEFTVDRDLCKRCWSCVGVCPMMIYEKKDEEVFVVEERTRLCIGCGHCMAACREKAVSVPTLSYDRDFFDLPAATAAPQDFLGLIRSRRSTRLFKEDAVPRETLEEIVGQISLAPMGFPPQNVQIAVLKDRASVEKVLPFVVAFYDKLIAWMKNPVARFFMRRELDLDVFNTIRNHIAPTYEMELEIMKRTGRDVITYGAPALLVFHADRGAECHKENIFIALTYGLLAAHAMGLGAAAIGLIPPAVERTPELRSMLGIPAENEVMASMIVGHPRVKFRRCIRRGMKNVNWVE